MRKETSQSINHHKTHYEQIQYGYFVNSKHIIFANQTQVYRQNTKAI